MYEGGPKTIRPDTWKIAVVFCKISFDLDRQYVMQYFYFHDIRPNNIKTGLESIWGTCSFIYKYRASKKICRIPSL